ncbi:MAG: L-2-amino-thiazoline-4-carboxylic acid hydrolase [Candidatus Thorarchaeota archaeon]
MKCRKSGIPDPRALEIPRQVQPMDLAKQSPWKRLDSLLRQIRNFDPRVLQSYTKNLQVRYDELSKNNVVVEKSIDVPTLLSDFENLREFPKLGASNLNYFLQVLDPSMDVDLIRDTIEVPQRNQIRAVLLPKYQNLLILTETIARDEAIEIYKTYHDELMRAGRSSQKDRYQTLKEYAERWIKSNPNENRGLVRIISEPFKGKVYLRKDTCLWNEAIQDLEDNELKYYVCCYQDFESARLANRSFVLTMERTIVEGHPFCDSVFHDTRIDDELIHPSEEFFSSMNPE